MHSGKDSDVLRLHLFALWIRPSLTRVSISVASGQKKHSRRRLRDEDDQDIHILSVS